VALPEVKQVHFIGIGGYGMSALAQVLLQMGYRVTGFRHSTTRRWSGSWPPGVPRLNCSTILIISAPANW